MAPANHDGTASPLADLRTPQFPFPNSSSIAVASGYDGLSVLWLMAGTPPSNPWQWDEPWFKTVLTLHDKTPVVIHPPSSYVIIVDFKNGFDPTPINLHFYANLYLAQIGGPQPGNTPIVT